MLSEIGKRRVIQMYISVHINIGNHVGVGLGLMITANSIVNNKAIHV